MKIMPYIPPSVVQEVKRMDLLTYLKNYEPYELVHFSGNTYTTRTHDSLKISNGKWMWWSQRTGGRSALDYLIKVKGYSFLEAVELLAEQANISVDTVKRLERGNEGSVNVLLAIADVYDVSLDYLVGCEDAAR